jgi:uncharacterized membrane protein YesL
MTWFTDRTDDNGPGVAKDLPPKQGLALFGSILRREVWELIKLNALIILFSVPIVTIPAAHAASTRIAVRMIRDENIYLLRDFWQAFCNLFVRATVAGLFFGICASLGAYAVYIYGQMVAHRSFYVLATIVCLAVFVFVLMIGAHALVLLSRSSLPFPALLRLSALATLAYPAPALAGLSVIATFWLAHFLFYPLSVFMPILFSFSLGTFILAFSVLKATEAVFPVTAAETDALAGWKS